MRTTLTVDDDLFHQLRAEAARSHTSFRETLNRRLRLGMRAGAPAGGGRRRFVVRPFRATGFAPGIDPARLNQILDTLESEPERP